MARLIDADELKKDLKELELRTADEWGWQEMCDGLYQSQELVDKQPTIEAEPVRHAQWVHLWSNKFRCTACERAIYVETLMGEPSYSYCPECGAKMDGGNNEQERTD